MLTDINIRKLKLPPKSQKPADKHSFENGLYLYVYANGIKRWFINYRFGGKQISLPVGYYPAVTLAMALQARDDAKQLRKQGIDPKAHHEGQQEAKQAELEGKPLFRAVLDTYNLKESPTHKGHKWNFNRIEKFKRDYPDICDTPAGEVTPLQLIEWRDDRLEEVKPASVSREHNLLSAVFTYAIKEMQLLDANPFSKVTKPKTSAPRQRRVSQHEIDIICEACGYERGTTPQNKTQQVAWCFIFAIMTAMRASEITGITWDNVELDKRFIHLPDTKNGSIRNVPLLDEAVQHIELMRGVDDKQLVTINAASLSTMFRTVRNRTILKDADIRFHDSRHEACTQLAKIIPIEILGKITGHKDLKILFNVYYNPTAEELADKLNQIRP